MDHVSCIFQISICHLMVLPEVVDIPAAGNHQSDEMETIRPEFGNRLDWVIVSRSEITVL